MKLHKSKISRRPLWVVIGFMLFLVIFGLLQLIEPVSITPITPLSQPLQFSGRALLVASDADMVATAYADGRLNRAQGVEDALSVMPLPLQFEGRDIFPVSVSNSVMSWPQIIAVSPNGQRAYIVEVRSRPADGIQEFDDIQQMPEGEQLTVVDISDLAQPRILESIPIGRNPLHISISPDGRLLTVDLAEPGRELAIIQLQEDGRSGRQQFFSLPGDRPESVENATIWHPSGNYLAVTQPGGRLSFYTVAVNAAGDISIAPYSQPLTIGNHLSNARFTRDGRFLLVPDLKWRTWGIRALDYLLNPRGEMISVLFEPASGNPPAIVSRTEVGLSPEGFALSPDNTLIATVNLRRTYLSANLPPVWRGKPYSSLSLVKFDPQSGQMRSLGEYGFEGLLPEQATFDASGRSLAVVIFHQREPLPHTGSVEFWEVISGDQPQLRRTGMRLDVTRGAHDIVLIP